MKKEFSLSAPNNINRKAVNISKHFHMEVFAHLTKKQMKFFKIALEGILGFIVVSVILIGYVLIRESMNTFVESKKGTRPKSFTNTSINPNGIVISHIKKDSTYSLIIQPKDTQVKVSKQFYELIKNKDTIK